MSERNEAIEQYLLNLPIKDKMLYSLYLQRDCDGFFRLSDTVDGNSNWRSVADQLHKEGYIEYPCQESYSTIGKITKKGIMYIEKAL